MDLSKLPYKPSGNCDLRGDDSRDVTMGHIRKQESKPIFGELARGTRSVNLELYARWLLAATWPI